MTKLLKVDFKRVLKDKMLIVIVILAGVFALTTPLLSYGLSALFEDEMGELINSMTTARDMFFNSFSIGGDFGLIVPVLLALIIRKDFSHGTIRNKIISGKSRTSIFISMYITCSFYLCVVVFAYAFLTLCVSLMLFDLQSTPFEMQDLWYILQSLTYELLVYLFVSAFLCLLCCIAKNVGIVIVAYIAIAFVITIITTILTGVTSIVGANDFDGKYDAILKVVEIVQDLNPFNTSITIGHGTEYSLRQILSYIFAPVTGIAGLLGLGILLFKKKDLK